MGKVKYATGIDYVQGALAKPKVKQGHKCGTYLLGTHRTAPTENSDCTRIYVKESDAYNRSTPLGMNEVAARNRFKTVAGMVKARQEDPSKITQDQLDFVAQKDLADGKKTMKAYLWKVCGAEYDQNH